jgi:hypothetical protein
MEHPWKTKSRPLTCTCRCPGCNRGTRTAPLGYDGFCQAERAGLVVALDAECQGLCCASIIPASGREIKPPAWLQMPCRGAKRPGDGRLPWVELGLLLGQATASRGMLMGGGKRLNLGEGIVVGRMVHVKLIVGS